jgi:serine/threonine-protein kinase RsbW
MVKPADDSIIITVPSKPEFLGPVRAFAGSVAAQLRLSVDDIDDVRLAIDEAFSYLLTLGSSDASEVVVALLPTAQELITTVSIDATQSPWPPSAVEDTLSWKVISGLVDRVALERSTEGRPSIVIVKRTLDATPA